MTYGKSRAVWLLLRRRMRMVQTANLVTPRRRVAKKCCKVAGKVMTKGSGSEPDPYAYCGVKWRARRDLNPRPLD
jgi:hypothetical protein